jgi:hypothetical protein
VILFDPEQAIAEAWARVDRRVARTKRPTLEVDLEHCARMVDLESHGERRED